MVHHDNAHMHVDFDTADRLKTWKYSLYGRQVQQEIMPWELFDKAMWV